MKLPMSNYLCTCPSNPSDVSKLHSEKIQYFDINFYHLSVGTHEEIYNVECWPSYQSILHLLPVIHT